MICSPARGAKHTPTGTFRVGQARFRLQVQRRGGVITPSQNLFSGPYRVAPSLPADGLVDRAKRLEAVPRPPAHEPRVPCPALVLILLLEHHLRGGGEARQANPAEENQDAKRRSSSWTNRALEIGPKGAACWTSRTGGMLLRLHCYQYRPHSSSSRGRLNYNSYAFSARCVADAVTIANRSFRAGLPPHTGIPTACR